MDLKIFLVWSAAAFAAYFVKGLAGFGNTPVHTGLMAFFRTNAELTPVDYILTLPANAAILFRYRKYLRREIWLPGALVTAAAVVPGAILLKETDSGVLKVIFGFVILLAGADMLRSRSAGRPAPGKAVSLVLTAVSGLVSGMFGIGLLLAAVMGRTVRDSRELKANLTAVFVADNIGRGIMYGVTGLLTLRSAQTALCLVPAMGLGLFVGVKSAGRFSEKTVRRCTAVVLMACGVLLAAGNI
ncbi:MAG: sulfite exporter TauE/SafE family protein [Clostridia bacterium]|nr:sulfite exporter TauE/SafE family protein [Clostridia bacterium]